MAYFTDVHKPRSYRRKVFDSFEDALQVLPDAEEYYSKKAYQKYFDKLQIECREVTPWMQVGDWTLGHRQEDEEYAENHK